MERGFGYYIFLELVIGAVFGVGLGAAIGNTALGVGLGALGGVFIGWFVAQLLFKTEMEKRKTSKQYLTFG